MPPAAEHGHGSLSLKRQEIRAPATVPAPQLVWEVRPGMTCLAGSRLGRVVSLPGEASEFLYLLLYFFSCGLFRRGPLAGELVLTAPEDGVLLWLLPTPLSGQLRLGTTLAAYFPLREWQAYEQLLERQDRAIRAGQPGDLPTLRAEEARLKQEAETLRQKLHERRCLQGGSGAPTKPGKLLETLLARAPEIDPARLAPGDEAALRQLAGQLAALLKRQFSLPPAELWVLFDAYLADLIVQEERFRRIDAEFLRRFRPAASAEAEQQLIVEWLLRKRTVVEQLIGSGEEKSYQLP